jgi:hypothetical protein
MGYYERLWIMATINYYYPNTYLNYVKFQRGSIWQTYSSFDSRDYSTMVLVPPLLKFLINFP